MFEQYAQALHERFPALTIVGDHYPPPVLRSSVAQLLGVIKFILIGLVVTSFNPFPKLNLPTPSMFHWAMDNKVRFPLLSTVFYSERMYWKLFIMIGMSVYLFFKIILS